jgi:copper resistance protein C
MRPALAIGVLLGVCGLGVAPAAAHTTLVATEPAADSTVTTTLEEVVLHFSGAVQTAFAEVEVIDPEGVRVQHGPTRPDGTAVHQALGSLERTGPHRVRYRVLAGDDHPLDGELVFDYQGPVSEPTPEVTAPPSPREHRTEEVAVAPRDLIGAVAAATVPPTRATARSLTPILAVFAAVGALLLVAAAEALLRLRRGQR